MTNQHSGVVDFSLVKDLVDDSNTTFDNKLAKTIVLYICWQNKNTE